MGSSQEVHRRNSQRVGKRMEAKEKREANVSRRREGSTISDAAERKCETPFPP